MGMYDTVRVPCPKCGEIYHAQSKSGDCNLEVHDLTTCPAEIIADVNRHAPFECEKCQTKFEVEFTLRVASVKVKGMKNHLWDMTMIKIILVYLVFELMLIAAFFYSFLSPLT